MFRRSIFFLVLITSISFNPSFADHHANKEKPVKHLDVAEVQNMEEAQAIFLAETEKLKSKTKLDNSELQEIHIITYTLEQSVAFFAENLDGEPQRLANEIAVVVENIHLDSENNRASETRAHLDKYFKMAESLASNF